MDIETTYQDTLEYLYSFIDYSLTHSFPAPENFDLDRLRAFLAHFGDPHMSYPVIHIAYQLLISKDHGRNTHVAVWCYLPACFTMLTE